MFQTNELHTEAQSSPITDFNKYYTAYLHKRNTNPIGVKPKNSRSLRRSAETRRPQENIASKTKFFDIVYHSSSPASHIRAYNISKGSLQTLWEDLCLQIRGALEDDKTVSIAGFGFFSTTRHLIDKSSKGVAVHRTPIFTLSEQFEKRYRVRCIKQSVQSGSSLVTSVFQPRSGFSKDVIQDVLADIVKCFGLIAQGLMGVAKFSLEFNGVCIMNVHQGQLKIDWSPDLLQSLKGSNVQDGNILPLGLPGQHKDAERNRKIIQDMGIDSKPKESVIKQAMISSRSVPVKPDHPADGPTLVHELKPEPSRTPTLHTLVPFGEDPQRAELRSRKEHLRSPLPPLSPSDSFRSVSEWRRLETAPERLKGTWRSQLNAKEEHKKILKLEDIKDRQVQDQMLAAAASFENRKKQFQRDILKDEWLRSLAERDSTLSAQKKREKKTRERNWYGLEPYADLLDVQYKNKKICQDMYKAQLNVQITEALSKRRPATTSPLPNSEDKLAAWRAKVGRQKEQADILRQQIEEKRAEEEKLRGEVYSEEFVIGNDEFLSQKSKNLAMSIGKQLQEELSEKEKERKRNLKSQTDYSIQQTLELLDERERQIAAEIQNKKSKSTALREELQRQQEETRTDITSH